LLQLVALHTQMVITLVMETLLLVVEQGGQLLLLVEQQL